MQFCFGHPCGQPRPGEEVQRDDTQRALLQSPLSVLLTPCLVSSPIRLTKLFPASWPPRPGNGRLWQDAGAGKGSGRPLVYSIYVQLLSGSSGGSIHLWPQLLTGTLSSCSSPSNAFFCSPLLLPVLVTIPSLLAPFSLSTCPC